MASPPVKSAARALQLLEHFARLRQPQSLTQLAQALGLPASSATVLLKSLVAMGYLNYDRGRRLYFPTLQVARLGDWVPDALFGQAAGIDRLLRDLHHATGETVSLVVLNDICIQYIRVIGSRHALRFDVAEGSMRPLTRSAMGWLLLADQPPAAVDKLIRRANLAVAEPAERVTPARILAALADARRSGEIYAENMPMAGGATLGIALPCRIQGRLAVLGMGGALERIRPQRAAHAALMRALVAELPPAP